MAGACALVLLYAFGPSRELRFASPDDYDTLAGARALIAGGNWVVAPFACIAAVVSRLAAVDPMQAVRFLTPITWPGAAIARTVGAPSLNAAFAWSALLVTAVLSLRSRRPSHRRAPWHATAACTVALVGFSVPGARAGEGAGYVEDDAAARQALAVAQHASDDEWLVVAPLEQRVELPDPRRFMPLNDFVRRFGDRAGDTRFRFDTGGRRLFVFVEKRPLTIDPAATETKPRYLNAVAPYWLPNARARLERRALQLCEAYRRSHRGVTIHYEDANLRIYRIEH